MSVRQSGGAYVRTSLVKAIAFIAVIGLATAAQASIMYGNFGHNYGSPLSATNYLDVTESSGTDPVPPPMFGPPEVRDDQLDFDPMGFVSTTMGGPLEITDGQLNFTVEVIPGGGITSITLSEGGDYSFAGIGGLGTSVTAGVSIWVEILEVDQVALATPITVSSSASYSTNMSVEGMKTLAPWTLDATVDLAAFLGVYDKGVTKAEIVIDNQLITNSEMDSLAFIAKKDFKITPDGDLNVPEPASLVILAMAGLLVVRRR